MKRPNGSGNPFMDAAMLAIESQQVIALRMMKLAAGGPTAEAEARQMVEEKIDAATEAATLMTAAVLDGRPDQGAQDVVEMLLQKVRTNRKRLTG